MDWRKVMNEHPEVSPQYPQNPQYSEAGGNITDCADITDRDSKVKKLDQWFDAEIQAVISEFDKAGISVHNTPVEARKEALMWEDELTTAANNYDVQAFQEALSRWKEAWFADIRARDRF